MGIEARQRRFLYYTTALVGAGGGPRLLPTAGENGEIEKCPFRGPASVVVSGADIIHSRAGFVGFLSHDAIHAGDGLGGGFPASGINSGTAISHSCAVFFGPLTRARFYLVLSLTTFFTLGMAWAGVSPPAG